MFRLAFVDEFVDRGLGLNMEEDYHIQVQAPTSLRDGVLELENVVVNVLQNLSIIGLSLTDVQQALSLLRLVAMSREACQLQALHTQFVR